MTCPQLIGQQTQRSCTLPCLAPVEAGSVVRYRAAAEEQAGQGGVMESEGAPDRFTQGLRRPRHLSILLLVA